MEGAGWSGTWVFRVTYDAETDEVWFQTRLAQRKGAFGTTAGSDQVWCEAFAVVFVGGCVSLGVSLGVGCSRVGGDAACCKRRTCDSALAVRGFHHRQPRGGHRPHRQSTKEPIPPITVPMKDGNPSVSLSPCTRDLMKRSRTDSDRSILSCHREAIGVQLNPPRPTSRFPRCNDLLCLASCLDPAH